MPNLKIAFIVNRHQDPLNSLDTLKIDKLIDNNDTVTTLQKEILGQQNYVRALAHMKLWKVYSVNNIQACSSMSDFLHSSRTQ
jgi:hypothetical protein